jgi:SCP-2 sterol transfer family
VALLIFSMATLAHLWVRDETGVSLVPPVLGLSTTTVMLGVIATITLVADPAAVTTAGYAIILYGTRARSSGGRVDNAVDRFFDRLVDESPHPRLRTADGTIRFDLRRGSETEHWFVALDGGVVTVTHDDAEADCIVAMDREVFEGVVTGRMNFFAAMLRSEITASGAPGLLVRFQRLLPGPPSGDQAEAITTGKGGT